VAISDDVLRALRERLERMEARHARRLVEAYRRVHRAISAEAEALLAELREQQAQGRALTRGQIERMRRYRYLLAATQEEIDRYGAVVEAETVAGYSEFAARGAQDAAELVEAAYSDLPPDLRGSVLATFGRMPREAVEALVIALEEQSPLRRVTLARYGEQTAQAIGDALIEGVVLGRSPRDTAAELQRAYGLPLTKALTISRTEHVRAHRLATLESYRRNPHIVKGWIRMSSLVPGRTCMGCVALHGTKHGLDEPLEDHPNGLCYSVPDTVSLAELGITGVPDTALEVETGEQWFRRQPEAVQRRMMGQGTYEAWRAGQFAFEELVKWRHSDDWGDTPGVTPLRELLGE